VSLGLRSAVSNSSAENSSEIFNNGLNNCNKQKSNLFQNKYKKKHNPDRKNQIFEAHIQEIEYGS
jgi:hypothetical protein